MAAVRVDDAVLAAVLSALAGPRNGDRVAAVGVAPMVVRSLLAASQTDELVEEDARVVVAGAAHDVPTALLRLAPGGRIVAVAADAGAAGRVAAAAGLQMHSVQRIGRRVAWSARRPEAGD